MWAGTGGEGAKQWAGYLTELRNRGVEDVFMVCSDGLKGMTDAIEQIWPQAVDQQCVVHLVRASLRYTNRKDWQKITPALREIYTAPTVAAAEARFEEFAAELAATSTRRSSGCGAPPGRSSCRSWTTTTRSARSSTPPTSSRP